MRRPFDDERLPGVWGLPAVTLQPGELPEAGLRRVGAEKLGVRLEPRRLIGIQFADRGEYELILMDIEAELVEGEPKVFSRVGFGTHYIDQQWTRNLAILEEGAKKGSLCCRILLDSGG